MGDGGGGGGGAGVLQLVDVELALDLHPSRAGDVRAGVCEKFAALLMRHSELLGGVVLGYSALAVHGSRGALLEGLSAHFRVRLAARLLLFTPSAGSLLEGVVNKVEEDFVGLLVLGVLNASVRESGLRPRFDYVTQGNAKRWVAADDVEHVIKVGTRLLFTVQRVEDESDFLVIEAAVEGPTTGCQDWLASSRGIPPLQRRRVPTTPRERVQNGPTKGGAKVAASGGSDAKQPGGVKEEGGEVGHAENNQSREERRKRHRERKATAAMVAKVETTAAEAGRPPLAAANGSLEPPLSPPPPSKKPACHRKGKAKGGGEARQPATDAGSGSQSGKAKV
eukprot:SM000046S16376  [mRNA]  locus=s46:204697:206877:- [translate_table: standard]